MSSPHAPTAPAGGPNTSQRRSSRIANINAEKAKAPSAGAGRPANRNKSPHRRRNSAGAGRGGISKTKGKQPNRSSPHHAGPSADPGATTADPGATTASPAGPAGPAASPGGAVVNATPPRQGSPAASPGGATANDSPNTTPPLNSPIDNSGAGPSGIKRTVFEMPEKSEGFDINDHIIQTIHPCNIRSHPLTSAERSILQAKIQGLENQNNDLKMRWTAEMYYNGAWLDAARDWCTDWEMAEVQNLPFYLIEHIRVFWGMFEAGIVEDVDISKKPALVARRKILDDMLYEIRRMQERIDRRIHRLDVEEAEARSPLAGLRKELFGQ